MTTITLYREPSGYVAKFEGHGSEEIVRLFGTNVIPTGFTAQADPIKVKTEIRRLNPGASVNLGGFARLDELGG